MRYIFYWGILMSNARQDLAKRILVRLGYNLVDVELGPSELEEAIRSAIDKYRQRSENAVEEGYAFLELQQDKSEYKLPCEIVEVRELFRRGLGKTQGGVTFDPFSAAYTNFYLLEAGRQGGLSTYELFTQYQETIGTMFGEHLMFTWEPNKKKLTVVRNIRAPETILLWVYYQRTDDELIEDLYAKDWILRYSTAWAKLILGEGRGKFSQIIGPQGGTTLNGDALKAEGQQEIDKLEQEIMEYGSGEMPLGFLIG